MLFEPVFLKQQQQNNQRSCVSSYLQESLCSIFFVYIYNSFPVKMTGNVK
jgi:hypothetical protein